MSKTIIGKVISDKMTGSAVVQVEVWKTHRIIKKRFKRHSRFLVDNPNNEYKIGDLVTITETRPMSKNKNHKIVGKSGA